MPRTYSVERLQGGWVILVSGAKLLTCQQKSAALDAVRRATALLLHQQPYTNNELRMGKALRFQMEKKPAAYPDK